MSEIETIENELNIKLPIIYKEFLSICGKESKHIFCGCTIETRNLNFIQESGRKCYEKITTEKCPENLFFILEHQDYSFYYFDLNSGENPDVWLLIYGDEITNKNCGKLSSLFEKEIKRLTE